MDTLVTRGTLHDFADTYGLTLQCKRVPSNPAMVWDEWAKTASHWRCCLASAKTGQTMSLTFSQGSAHTDAPTVGDVLYCLQSDAQSIQNSDRFEDWAEDLGLDTDSRRLERSYMATLAQTRNLQMLLGPTGYAEFLQAEED